MYKYLREDSGRSQLKKPKCQRACKFCRKSHTTCEDTRPCQRCIKRDIAALCIADEAEQLQQQAQQQAQQLEQQQLDSGDLAIDSTGSGKKRGFSNSSYEDGHMDERTSIGASSRPRLNSFHGTRAGNSTSSGQTPSPSNSAELLASNTMSQPSNHIRSPDDPFQSQSLTFNEDLQMSPLVNTGNRMQWYDPAFQQAMDEMDTTSLQPSTGGASGVPLPDGISWSTLVEGIITPMPINRPSSKTNDFSWLSGNNEPAHIESFTLPTNMAPAMNPGGLLSTNNVASKDFRQPESSLSPGEGSEGPIAPYNYTFGYSRLRSYASELNDPSIKARISAATDRFKPTLHSCLAEYTDEQLVAVEAQFAKYVRQWLTFCETIPAPACVWRRTGEICAANRRMIQLLDMQVGVIKSGKLALYNVLDSMSFLDYWEHYASQVLINLADRTSFDTVVPVSFSKSGDRRKTHLLSSSMSFDAFKLPLVATAVFTPLVHESPASTLDIPTTLYNVS